MGLPSGARRCAGDRCRNRPEPSLLSGRRAANRRDAPVSWLGGSCGARGGFPQCAGTASGLRRRTPKPSSSGLHGPNIDAPSLEFGGTASRRRIGKGVVAVRRERDIDEASVLKHGAKLSLRESTGNSASPERDVLLCIVRHHLADDDVRDLQPSAWLEHAIRLDQYCGFVRAEVDHSIGDDDVNAFLFKG